MSWVWNYCGEIQSAARRYNRRWPSGFDLINLTSGSSKLLGLHSDTVQAVCKQFALSRDACGKRPRWRGRKSLGWIPFQAPRAIRLQSEAVIFLGRRYRLWLSRTGLAKSVLDAGWSQLRSRLRYKALRHGGEYIEVDERFSTQVCSACAARGGPQGREGLVVREWVCSRCGARHDRDINSAINILFSGRNVGLQQTEIPSLQRGEDVNRVASFPSTSTPRPRAIKGSAPKPTRSGSRLRYHHRGGSLRGINVSICRCE